MTCANYMNQEAIDLAIREANERLQRIDKASGVENPPLQYSEGTCFCMECHDAGNPDLFFDILTKAAGDDRGLHRVCYKELDAHCYRCLKLDNKEFPGGLTGRVENIAYRCSEGKYDVAWSGGDPIPRYFAWGGIVRPNKTVARAQKDCREFSDAFKNRR